MRGAICLYEQVTHDPLLATPVQLFWSLWSRAIYISQLIFCSAAWASIWPCGFLLVPSSDLFISLKMQFSCMLSMYMEEWATNLSEVLNFSL